MPARRPRVCIGETPATLDSRRKQLAELSSEHWEYTMRTNPEYASVLGTKSYN
jgi:hypothetical protein